MPVEKLIVQAAEITLLHDTHWDLTTSDVGDSWCGEHKHKLAGDVAYVIRPEREAKKGNKPRALWITGKCICFKTKIVSQGGKGDLAGWTAGFIQSIRESFREAHYEKGETRKLRLDTTAGLLKDGQEDSIFYADSKTIQADSCKIRMDDSPNFETPLEYGPLRSKLQKTSGCDKFSSFPILVKGKTIILLSQVDWEIQWEGAVTWPDDDNYHNVEWKPSGVFMSVAQKSQNARVIDDAHAQHSSMPFSLDLNEAENYCEIFDNGGWRPSTMTGGLRQNATAPRIWQGET